MLYRKGKCIYVLQIMEWAANDFSMSLDLDPSNSEAWLNKGISLLNMGNNQSACRDFRQALKLETEKQLII